jgi:L-cystine transport system substrate-binding protein
MKKLVLVVAGILLVLYPVFAKGGREDQVANSGEPRTITVAYIGVVPQFQYETENNELTGYEIEVLREIDALLPQYSFEYEKYGFTDILIAVANGKADIGVCQFEESPERKGRYRFTDPYSLFKSVLVVNKNDAGRQSSFHSIDDLAGKTIWVPRGNADAASLERFNTEHPDNKINIDYSSAGYDNLIANILAGALDGIVVDANYVQSLNAAYNDVLTVAGEPLRIATPRFVLNLDAGQLQAEINGALKELKRLGKLSELSIKFIGEDLTAGL